MTRLEPYSEIHVRNDEEALGLFKQLISNPSELDRPEIRQPLAIYGGGGLGRMAKSFFDHLDIEISCVIDRNASHYTIDSVWEKIPVIHPDEATDIFRKQVLLVVCIATVPIIELMNFLKSNGWDRVVLFYDLAETYSHCTPISNGWFCDRLSDTEKGYLETVYASLYDAHSRMAYLQFLAWRICRVEIKSACFHPNMNNRFFIPEVISILNKNEVFVDCGAHKGFVLKKFLSLVQNHFLKAIAIEPDDENFKICHNAFKHIDKISIIKCALSDQNGEASFYQGFDFASKLNQSGESKVEMSFLDELKIPSTYIKMHLEGGELDALNGAKKTILHYRPIVAVTIYHSLDGLWRIPLFFSERLKDYCFYVRCHSWVGTGTVFYAIPKERCMP